MSFSHGSKIMVIGCGGVGMAHILSALKIGIRDFIFIDTDSDVLARFELPTWHNKLGDEIDDSIDISQPEYKNLLVRTAGNVNQLTKDEIESVDLVIIATPSYTHAAIASRVAHAGYKGKYLIEKPISNHEKYRLEREDIDYEVSLEWKYHPELNEVKQILAENIDSIESVTVMFHHGNPPAWVTEKIRSIEKVNPSSQMQAIIEKTIDDLNPHCESILSTIFSPVGLNITDREVSTVRFKVDDYSNDVDRCSLIMNYSLNTTSIEVKAKFGYIKDSDEMVAVILEVDGDIYTAELNWIQFKDTDLFGRQLGVVLSSVNQSKRNKLI